MSETTGLRIGRVADLAGVGVETIRFYEREGLVPQPPRRPSGYRQYPPDTVDRIRFIKRAKELGFTLREIRELLHLRTSSGGRCEDVRRRAESKVVEIEGKIRDLEAMQRALESLIAACQRDAPVADCPILEALSGPEAR